MPKDEDLGGGSMFISYGLVLKTVLVYCIMMA